MYMDFNTRYEHYKNVVRLLEQRSLGEALDLLKEDLQLSPDGTSSDEWTDINESYRYLLDYLKRGVTDEHRGSLFKQLVSRAYRLNDRLLYIFRSQYVDDDIEIIRKDLKAGGFTSDIHSLHKELLKWGTIMKGVEASPLDDPAGDSEIIRKYEEFYTRLFNAVFTSEPWTKDDLEEALQLLEEDAVYKYDLLLLESAVTMSLGAYYDEYKFRFLLGIISREHDYVLQARAIVGVAICCLCHDDKILLNEELLDVLTEDLPQNPVFLEGMRLLQNELFISLQTDSTSKKINEEIIPAMMKSTYFRPNKFGFQNVDDYLNPKDSEPNGEEDNERRSIEKKIREISDMHLNGLDVYMTTFSHLKNFPFFNKTANWFYPFNPYHYTVKGVYFTEGKKPSIISSILQGVTFCNSDKYSFSMLLGKIGTMERQLLETQINNELDGQKLSGLLEKYSDLQFLLEIRSYLQDLYRFYKLSPLAGNRMLFNIYKHNLNFLHYRSLKAIIGDEDSLTAIAEAVYKTGDYENALEYFKELEALGSHNASVYQREGYCRQMLKQYQPAVQAYQKADLIKPGEIWTYRQLGYCYRHLRDYGKALEYYLKVEEKDPDNKFVLLRTGECLLQEKRYKEAQQRFFKVEYNEPKYLPALRAIAWCAFLAGDLERAKTYYDKILGLFGSAGNPAKKEWATDYLNAGHTALAQGHIKEAILLYAQYANLSQNEALKELWDDFPILNEKYKISRLEMQLLVEAVRTEE